MTINQARATLKAWRLQKAWSFDALYADMVRVLGERAPSAPTIRRFIEKETTPEQTTAHVIGEYLDRTEVDRQAVA